MRDEMHQKITARHLQRSAYLYVRQSTVRQVFENTESTARQYALQQRGLALGWTLEQIVVIDSDQGQSGASAADREGFKQLVTEVSLGKAGIVMSLEVSRLARNSTDWHRLIEISALTDTLILDEDGVYDPSHFNDRLLLGLKGTMSEAELHILRARLRGGLLNKVRRGELEMKLPVGLVHDDDRGVVLDPDQRIQESVRTLFRVFRQTGSASGTVRAFREQGLEFPRSRPRGRKKGEMIWGPLQHSRTLSVLHNPRYAGAFSFGRTRRRRLPDGASRRCDRVPRDEWIALIPDAHAGYITWDEFTENEQRLRENAQACGADRKAGPAREGPALLQGIAVCGNCGRRMTPRYHQRRGKLVPTYQCLGRKVQRGEPACQVVPGGAIDKALGELLVESMTPVAIEVACAVQEEMQQQIEQADRLRYQRVEQGRYEADRAKERYMSVDPSNRLVADTLEAEWNAKLRALQEAKEEYDLARQVDRIGLDDAQREAVLALAKDFPRMWNNPDTPDRERKRAIRLLVEDVTILKGDKVTMHVRFRGGTFTTITTPRTLSAWEIRKTPEAILTEIDQLLDEHTDGEIANILNEQGRARANGRPFEGKSIAYVRRAHGLRSRYDRLRERGLLTIEEIASRLSISRSTAKVWRQLGHLTAYAYNDRPDFLFEPPSSETRSKHDLLHGQSSSRPQELRPQQQHEVQ
jgi:DNA invertase Pin-like site-specific DNA recombinase